MASPERDPDHIYSVAQISQDLTGCPFSKQGKNVTFAGTNSDNMKKYPAILALITTLLLTACSEKSRPESNTISVSILPLRNIVEEIVGDDFEIDVLVPAGASPETFEPTPKQFLKLNQARMVFNVGLIDFETTLLDKLENQEKVIDLSRGIRLIEGSCSHAKHPEEAQNGSSQVHHHAHAHGIDPHVWTSPKALQIMAKNAYEAIRKQFPDSAKYAANYDRLIEKLQELDIRTREKIDRSGVTYFIVYHPALTYYARDYGIRQVAIESEGKEPSARQLGEIIRNARRDGVNKIFYQNQFPQSVVEIIARDINARYIEIDPLAEQIIDNIDRITDLITEP